MSRFGFSTEPSSGGDFLPIVKYDARAGRLFRVDRVDTGQGFTSEPVDITSSAKFVADFENLETGWINFATGGAPDFRMVPLGHELPGRPSENHKNGIRFMLKLDKASGGDKPIREIAGTAKAFLSGVERVFADYEAGKAENPGKLPVLAMEGSTPIKSGSGDKQSTNYVPKFKIVAWAARGDLVFQPKGGGGASASDYQREGEVKSDSNFASIKTPPSTGSQRAEPPKQPETVEDDFG